ncbi:MAG: hypothetical protein QXP01_01750 [Candidatus Hadarchaeum sp.]
MAKRTELTRFNALKHGLRAKHTCLPCEDEQERKEFSSRMIEALAPVGEVERFLAERIIVSAWRLKRAVDIERSWLELLSAYMDSGVSKGELMRMLKEIIEAGMLRMKYETSAERQMYRALQELQRLQAERMTVDVRLEKT